MPNAKRKGTRREHQTMQWLEAQGYRCCRSAASLGEWDVIAIGQDVLLVQVKSNRWPGSDEMRALVRFPAPPGVRKLVHRWRDGVTSAPDVRELL